MKLDRRLGYRLITIIALGAAALGVALPVLPTAPFLVLAAWSASHHSPELEARLLANPRVGPHILAWRHERALSAKAKRGVVVGMVLSYLLTWWLVPSVPVRAGVGIILLVVASYMVTRPVPSGSYRMGVE